MPRFAWFLNDVVGFCFALQYNVGKTAWVLLYNKDARQAHQLFRDLVRLIIRNFVPDLRNRCGQIVNTSTMILRRAFANNPACLDRWVHAACTLF